MPHRDEQEWRRLILEKKNERDKTTDIQAQVADELAQLIREAKRDGIRHGKIAEEWLGITRDGLTKYLKRHDSSGGNNGRKRS